MVWRTARTLDAALAGRVLSRSDFRVPRYATTDLTGRTVMATVSRGKHLLTRVDGGVSIHTHLRMDGSWRVGAAGSPPARDHRVRLVLANDAWQAVGRLLGVVEVLRTKDEEQVVGHLGPDLLGPDWDPDEAVRRLRAGPERPVGEALLDQQNLAGIGNVYKAEVLFLRGIDPWRPVTTGVAGRGRQTWVYGRPGRPCRRCGTQIRSTGRSGTSRAGQGTDNEERVTFWCPRCQPAAG